MVMQVTSPPEVEERKGVGAGGGRKRRISETQEVLLNQIRQGAAHNIEQVWQIKKAAPTVAKYILFSIPWLLLLLFC